MNYRRKRALCYNFRLLEVTKKAILDVVRVADPSRTLILQLVRNTSSFAEIILKSLL